MRLVRFSPLSKRQVSSIWGQLSAKIARFASCVFKCGAFLAKKGAAMWDAGILKGWADRFSTIQFGWGTFKAVSDLSSDAVVSVEEVNLRN